MTVSVEEVVKKSPGRMLDAPLPVTRDGVLKELFQLLEDYAPAWYTQEHHDRAVEALLQSELRGAA